MKSFRFEGWRRQERKPDRVVMRGWREVLREVRCLRVLEFSCVALLEEGVGGGGGDVFLTSLSLNDCIVPPSLATSLANSFPKLTKFQYNLCY